MVCGFTLRMYGRRFVFMHVNAKKTAFAGLLAACSVLLVILSAVIESNSLFLIAAASFCVGIAIREWGLVYGFCFLTACVILDFFLAPNKMYGITFAAMGIYIFVTEFFWERIARAKHVRRKHLLFGIGKYVIFNCIYIPVVVCFPSLLFTKRLSAPVMCLVLLAGQAGLFLYDKAYVYVQGQLWGKIRQKFI